MKRILLALALTAAFGGASQAQGGATVPPADPVYGVLDRLAAAGLVDSSALGQRPMSERTILEILDRSRRLASGRSIGGWLLESIETHHRYFRMRVDSLPRAVVDRAGASIAMASSPERGIERDGVIDVAINPLLANRLGVPTTDGVTGALHASVTVFPARWLTVATTIRGGGRAPRGQSVAGDLRPEQLYARAVYRNVAVSLGRDYLFFGQGTSAAMLNSLNPRGLDMLRISSERAFPVPLASRVLGPMAGTFYLADLGARQNFPHAQLAGYKLSFRPHRLLELGVTVTSQMGGRGAPGGTLAQRLEDLVPLIDALFLHRTNLLFSNKFAGLDARLAIPRLRGLQLYMDGAVDDFDGRRLWSSVTDDAGYVWGASLDCVVDCGKVRLVAEYHSTGLRYYTHALYTSGYTLERQLIGNPLGPEGQAGHLSMEIGRGSTRVSLSAAHEIRSGDIWGTVSTTPDDTDFRFVILEHRPAERRWRLTASASGGRPDSRLAPRIGLGLERVDRFRFQEGAARNNFLIEGGIDIRPGARRR
jgi:hypothetical protein